MELGGYTKINHFDGILYTVRNYSEAYGVSKIIALVDRHEYFLFIKDILDDLWKEAYEISHELCVYEFFIVHSIKPQSIQLEEIMKNMSLHNGYLEKLNSRFSDQILELNVKTGSDWTDQDCNEDRRHGRYFISLIGRPFNCSEAFLRRMLNINNKTRIYIFIRESLTSDVWKLHKDDKTALRLDVFVQTKLSNTSENTLSDLIRNMKVSFKSNPKLVYKKTATHGGVFDARTVRNITSKRFYIKNLTDGQWKLAGKGLEWAKEVYIPSTLSSSKSNSVIKYLNNYLKEDI